MTKKIVLIFLFTIQTFAQLTETEKIVLEKINKSEKIDFIKDRYPSNILSGNFIELILLKVDSISNNRTIDAIDIAGAIIKGHLGITNKTLSANIYLTKCIFIDNMVITNSNFTGRVELIECKFERSLDFTLSNFAKNLGILYSEIREKVNLRDITVVGNCFMMHNKIFDDLILHGATFEKLLDISESKFSGNVYARKLNVSGSFYASNCNFYGTATFEHMVIVPEFKLNKTIFNNTVKLNFSTIKNLLDFRNAKFLKETKAANIKVGGDIWGDSTTFNGYADFSNSSVSGNFYLTGSKFNNRTNFYTIKILSDFILTGTTFMGEVSFVKFNSIVVNGILDIDNVAFNDTVDFISATIGSQLKARGVQFLGEDKTVSFNGSKSNGLYFNYAIIKGPLNLNNIKCNGSILFASTDSNNPIEIKNSELNGLIIDSSYIKNLDLTSSSISEYLEIKNSDIDDFIAFNLNIYGDLVIDSLIVSNNFFLVNSKTSTFTMLFFDWPNNKDSVSIDGFSFDYIPYAEYPGTWKYLLELYRESKFSISVYSNLENYYNNLGMKDVANAIYKERKDREIEESNNILEIIFNSFFKIFVGFGRNPELSIVWSLIFIFWGYFSFSKNNVVQRNTINPEEKFHRFVYAMDVFLPVVNFKEDDTWKLQTEKRIKQTYLLFTYVNLKLWGWVLTILTAISLSNLVN